MTQTASPLTVAILGTGLIGTSLGMALRKPRPSTVRVVGYDVDPGAVELARNRGAFDDVAADPATAVTEADIVFICTPPGTIAEIAAVVGPVMQPGTILTDVASVKRAVTATLEVHAGTNVNVIGGHPMVAVPKQGARYAAEDTFVGTTWLLCPAKGNDGSAYERLKTVIESVGAQVTNVDAASHDALVAVTTYLPQLTASTLMNLATEHAQKNDAEGVLFTSGEFHNLTRTAVGTPAALMGICDENRDEIVAVLDEYAGRVEQLRASLLDQDDDQLETLFSDAYDTHCAFPNDAAEISVTIEDEPGAIARVVSVIAEAGVNVERISVGRLPDGTGVLKIGVASRNDAETVRQTLESNDYRIGVPK